MSINGDTFFPVVKVFSKPVPYIICYPDPPEFNQEFIVGNTVKSLLKSRYMVSHLELRLTVNVACYFVQEEQKLLHNRVVLRPVARGDSRGFGRTPLVA